MKKENKSSLLVGNKWIVYREIGKEIVKLDVDNVVRKYIVCEEIGEGLLG